MAAITTLAADDVDSADNQLHRGGHVLGERLIVSHWVESLMVNHFRSECIDLRNPAGRKVNPNVSMANCQTGLSAVVFEVLIPLPGCAI